MAFAAYATKDEFKQQSSIPDAIDEPVISRLLDAVSRKIDEFCGRHFWQDGTGGSPVTRYFTAEATTSLDIDDLVSLSTLKTDEDGDRVYEITWAATDYDLLPLNQQIGGRPWTYTELATTPRGIRSFPAYRRGVEIAGVWGWPSVPATIKEACLLQVSSWFKRKDAPFGVTGGAEFGQLVRIRRLDPDVEDLLWDYTRTGFQVAG